MGNQKKSFPMFLFSFLLMICGMLIQYFNVIAEVDLARFVFGLALIVTGATLFAYRVSQRARAVDSVVGSILLFPLVPCIIAVLVRGLWWHQFFVFWFLLPIIAQFVFAFYLHCRFGEGKAV